MRAGMLGRTLADGGQSTLVGARLPDDLSASVWSTLSIPVKTAAYCLTLCLIYSIFISERRSYLFISRDSVPLNNRYSISLAAIQIVCGVVPTANAAELGVRHRETLCACRALYPAFISRQNHCILEGPLGAKAVRVPLSRNTRQRILGTVV